MRVCQFRHIRNEVDFLIVEEQAGRCQCGSSSINDFGNSSGRGQWIRTGYVEFYKTDRSVHTASSEQVRQPIFRDGLFQWRNYEPWLGPLEDSLGDAVARFRE